MKRILLMVILLSVPLCAQSPEAKSTPAAQQSITISKLPPVTIAKNGIDWAVLANYLLVAVGVGGIAVAVWTLCYIRQQVNEMRRQRKLMLGTLKAIEKQADIANRTLIAQFRPKVIVRSIGLVQNKVSWNGDDGKSYWKTDSWTVELLIVNIGGTVIQNGSVEMRWREVPERHRYQPLHCTSIASFPLKAGGENPIAVLIPECDGLFGSKMYVAELEFKDRKTYRHKIRAVGLICYTDESGTTRKSGFSRDLDVETMKFVASKDPEEEYQD